MAEGAHLLAVHVRKRFEQIESADVIPDGLERAALPTELFEIWLILRQQRVVWRKRHVAAFGQFAGVVAVRVLAESDDRAVADDVVGAVQAKNRRGFFVTFQQIFGYEQIGRRS